MAITSKNPRRTRLLLVLAGIAVVVTGAITWGTGDIDRGVAEVGIENASDVAWSNVLGFESDRPDELAQAEAERDAAENQMTLGLMILSLGVALIALNWFVKPVPLRTPGLNLTPEQRAKALELYYQSMNDDSVNDPGAH